MKRWTTLVITAVFGLMFQARAGAQEAPANTCGLAAVEVTVGDNIYFVLPAPATAELESVAWAQRSGDAVELLGNPQEPFFLTPSADEGPVTLEFELTGSNAAGIAICRETLLVRVQTQQITVADVSGFAAAVTRFGAGAGGSQQTPNGETSGGASDAGDGANADEDSNGDAPETDSDEAGDEEEGDPAADDGGQEETPGEDAGNESPEAELDTEALLARVQSKIALKQEKKEEKAARAAERQALKAGKTELKLAQKAESGQNLPPGLLRQAAAISGTGTLSVEVPEEATTVIGEGIYLFWAAESSGAGLPVAGAQTLEINGQEVEGTLVDERPWGRNPGAAYMAQLPEELRGDFTAGSTVDLEIEWSAGQSGNAARGITLAAGIIVPFSTDGGERNPLSIKGVGERLLGWNSAPLDLAVLHVPEAPACYDGLFMLAGEQGEAPEDAAHVWVVQGEGEAPPSGISLLRFIREFPDAWDDAQILEAPACEGAECPVDSSFVLDIPVDNASTDWVALMVEAPDAAQYTWLGSALLQTTEECDAGGGTGGNDPPTAVLSADPLTGPAPLEVFLDASGSTDTDGPLGVSFEWDFGDGQDAGISPDPTIEHVYHNPGTYTVTVIVHDGDATDTASATIEVAPRDGGGGALPAPQLSAPATPPAPGQAFLMDWNDVEGAAVYEMVMSDTAAFETILAGFFPGVSEETVPGQNAGTYFLRVRAWDKLPEEGGNPSEWSNVVEVVVGDGGGGGGTLPAPQLSGPAAPPAANESFVMDWNDVTGAVVYELVMAENANFDPVVAGFFPALSEETINGQAAGAYFLRVRAWDDLPENGGTAGEWSNVVEVVVGDGGGGGGGTLPAPDLTGPATPPAAGASFTVDWNDVTGAAIYELVMAESEAFDPVIAGFFPGVSEETINGQAAGTYFLRVRAWDKLPEDGGTPGDWSNVLEVVVGDGGGGGGGGGTLPAPQLTGPSEPPGAGVAFAVDWNDVTGAAIYELVMAESEAFDPVIAGFFPGVSEETVTGQAAGTYFLRVRAWDDLPENGGTAGDWSNVVQVVVGDGGGGGVLPAPQLTLPANPPAANESFLVDWNDVAGAVIYELVMAENTNFDPVIAGFFPGISEETINGQAAGTYFLRVRAWDALPEDGGTAGDWSNVGELTVGG